MHRGKAVPVLAMVAVIILVAGYAVPHLQETPSDSPSHIAAPDSRSPKEVVQVFLRAVDRGELTLFHYILNRTILIPRRVEYAYELDHPIPTVTVYSELREAVPVPGQPDMAVRAVTAVLGNDGSIIETRAHIYGREDAQGPGGQ
jgi:hypothetical protein